MTNEYNLPSGALLKTTDALGNETQFNYDFGVGAGTQTGELKGITDALGRQTSYGLDGAGRGWRISETDAAEARLVGHKAVEFSANEKNVEGSIVMIRKSSEPYAIDVKLEPLKNVARFTKHMPDNFINKQGNDVTKAFLDYARPLVGELPVVGSLSELK